MPMHNRFRWVRGEDVQITYTIHETPEQNSPVVDLTGWLLSFKIKRKHNDPDPAIISAVAVVTDAAAGKLSVTYSVQSLRGDYHHSLWRTNPGAKSCLDDGITSISDSSEF